MRATRTVPAKSIDRDRPGRGLGHRGGGDDDAHHGHPASTQNSPLPARHLHEYATQKGSGGRTDSGRGTHSDTARS